MTKPIVDVSRTNVSSVSGTPLLFDSGVKFDDPKAFFDRWYPGDVVSNQNEIPRVSASAEKISASSDKESVLISSSKEKVSSDSKKEDVNIKNVEEF